MFWSREYLQEALHNGIKSNFHIVGFLYLLLSSCFLSSPFLCCCSQIPGNVEYQPKSVVYSRKQNLFLVVFELNGAENEVVLYKENTDTRLAKSKDSTVKGRYIYKNQFQVFTENSIHIVIFELM